MRNQYMFERDEKKNKLLQQTRNISFGQIVKAIEIGGLVAIIPHYNTEKYAHQKIFGVLINGYMYAVPYVQKGKTCFLKTIYKDRNLTSFYLLS
ncbi:MAG: toxin [candidate division SR1 bacterium]|nr:toxin [candidate division SR1 bacterium]